MRRFSGQQVRNRRQAAGLRPEHLAVAVGKSAAAIHAYEVGTIDPPSSVVAGLAAALGCAPGDLFADAEVVA